MMKFWAPERSIYLETNEHLGAVPATSNKFSHVYRLYSNESLFCIIEIFFVPSYIVSGGICSSAEMCRYHPHIRYYLM